MSIFATLLPNAISCEATPAMWGAGLHPEEAACIAQAREGRRREFAAGRHAARAAIASLGLVPGPIVVGRRRTPVFPPAVVGSITHTGDYCAASVAMRGKVMGLGIDAEGMGPLGDGVAELVLRPDEHESLRGLPADYRGKLAFSAKEAFYKAWYPHYWIELDFLDVRVEFDPASASFTARLCAEHLPPALKGRGARGRYHVDELRVYTALTIDFPGLEHM